MNEAQEEIYLRGERHVWRNLLQQCLQQLGYLQDDEDLDAARLVLEREEALSRLRSLCDDFGDNEWAPDLSLGDVIDKHLGKHLHANFEPLGEGDNI